MSYTAPASPAAVVQHYEVQLHKAGVAFEAAFDGIGTAIRVAEEKTSCVVRINEQEGGVGVRASCALPTADVFSPILPEPAPPVAAAQQNPASSPSSASRTVQYRIEGSARWVSVTYKNASGATEQKVVVLPFEHSFQVPAGAPVSLSAQKIRVTRPDMISETPHAVQVVANGIDGTVHVMIRVDDKLLQEANTSAPHGLATASGIVPN